MFVWAWCACFTAPASIDRLGFVTAAVQRPGHDLPRDFVWLSAPPPPPPPRLQFLGFFPFYFPCRASASTFSLPRILSDVGWRRECPLRPIPRGPNLIRERERESGRNKRGDRFRGSAAAAVECTRLGIYMATAENGGEATRPSLSFVFISWGPWSSYRCKFGAFDHNTLTKHDSWFFSKASTCLVCHQVWSRMIFYLNQNAFFILSHLPAARPSSLDVKSERVSTHRLLESLDAIERKIERERNTSNWRTHQYLPDALAGTGAGVTHDDGSNDRFESCSHVHWPRVKETRKRRREEEKESTWTKRCYHHCNNGRRSSTRHHKWCANGTFSSGALSQSYIPLTIVVMSHVRVPCCSYDIEPAVRWCSTAAFNWKHSLQ